MVELRRGPRVVVALQSDYLAVRTYRLRHERTGADRLHAAMRIVGHRGGRNVAEDVLGQDPGSQGQWERRAGRFERELDASPIYALDLDVAPELGAGLKLQVGGILQRAIREQHVTGAELDAVRPAHVVPDRDRIAEVVVGDRRGAGQQRLRLLPGRDSRQALVDEVVDVARVVCGLEKRAQGADRPDS